MKQLFKNLTWRHLINVIALAVIGYMTVATLNVIARNYELQREVDRLQEEIALLELQNNELEYQIAYYQTDAFADKEARDKLGLAAPGEQVVIFPDKIPSGVDIEPATTTEELPRDPASNWQQWMYFLFRIEP